MPLLLNLFLPPIRLSLAQLFLTFRQRTVAVWNFRGEKVLAPPGEKACGEGSLDWGEGSLVLGGVSWEEVVSTGEKVLGDGSVLGFRPA
jgi:hypothetical protein